MNELTEKIYNLTRLGCSVKFVPVNLKWTEDPYAIGITLKHAKLNCEISHAITFDTVDASKIDDLVTYTFDELERQMKFYIRMEKEKTKC